MNGLLDEIRASIYRIYHEILRRDNNVTSEKVKNEFLGISEKQDTLLSLFQKHTDDVLKLVGITKSKSSFQKMNATKNHMENFLKKKYKLSDISLKEIDHMFISDFEVYLRTTSQCQINTAGKFIQRLKRIITIAQYSGLIVGNPFANYKIKFTKVDRGYLAQDELEAIMQRSFPNKRLEQVRDIFIFTCFTGLSYIDVKNLRTENIRKSFDGNLW